MGVPRAPVWIGVAALTLLAGPAPVTAAGLDALLARAAEVDPAIALATAQAEGTAARVGQARAGLLPRLTTSAGYTRNQVASEFTLPGQIDPVVIVPINQLEASARLDVPLMDLAAWSALSAAGECRDAAQHLASAQAEAALFAVAQGAWTLRTSLLAQEAAAAALKASQEMLDLASARGDAGAGSNTDLLQARADLAEARGIVAQAGADVASARRALAARTGVDTLPEDLAPRPLPEGDLAASAQDRPELASARASLACQDHAFDAQRRGAAPTVAGFVQERVTNATGFAGQPATWSTGVTLSWTALDGGLRGGQIGEASANRRAAQATLAQLERAVADDLADARLRLETAALLRDAAQERSLASADLAADAQYRFQAGTATAAEVSVALSAAFQSEVDLARSEARFALAIESLRIAAGQPMRYASEQP